MCDDHTGTNPGFATGFSLSRMKSNIRLIFIFVALAYLFAGCSDAPLVSPSATMTATLIPVDTTTPTPSATLPPTRIFTPTLALLVLPAVTMSPQEVERGLLELLKTNGNCTGKCIGGIWPDEMTVQEAVNIMSQWGMVRIGKNSQGKTFLNLDPNLLYGQIGVYLSVGTWTEELETIDKVAIRIQDVASGDRDAYIGEEWWRENWDAWRGVRFDSLLKAYGVPSFVGYDFATTVEAGSSLEGRTISYGMEIQYEQTNLDMFMEALAYYDGETLFLCPFSDPHYLLMEINPDRPLKELQEFFPVSWEALTATDLEAFYEVFTDGNNPDGCVTTTLEQIQALQPDFR